MLKPFDTLYAELEKALKGTDRKLQGPERYLHGIGLIREKIGKLRVQGDKVIREKAKEIEYFRQVWPAFYSRLFFYIRLHGIELSRPTVTDRDWTATIRQEEGRVTAFFRANREFWQYYRSGASLLDEQFTRAYSRNRIFDPLALVMDQEAATLASYKAAWCLAMHNYGEWLAEERTRLSAGSDSAAELGYSWGTSDADLAEWLFGIQAVGAIHYKGQPADMSRLQKWARLAVGREVANIYDRGRLLRGRKKERLAFTKKLASALEKKWDQAEGKFD